jgi:ATPase subunit of ABC transporter with duplicated ATPase domains
VASPGRSGQIVSRLDGVVVDRGSFRLGPIDLTITSGERVAVLGANGSGKTTLLDAALGRVAPSAGHVRLGPSVVVGEVEQARDRLADAPSLLRAFQDATGMEAADARTLLAKFGLVADHVTRAPTTLSPGERTRATLALLMANGANVLVLDEPTNHLDLPAIEQLEAALDGFDGTVLLVTHDRALLERVRLTRTVEVAAGRVVRDEPR